MTFTELIQKYGSARTIPNDDLYEYLDGNRERLIEQYRKDQTTIPNSPLGQEVRLRCQTDLLWMMRYFLWETNPAGVDTPISENRITPAEYQIIADLFVKKDPSRSILEQDKAFKSRLLLWPRGGYKSTFDIGDVVQWILCFPHIRILFLTGEDRLAVGFIEELKGHFVLRANLTLMNMFFPEFCIPEEGKQEKEIQFTCPVWVRKNAKRREPTVLASSIGAIKAGRHFELIKADDSVCDSNSENTEICKKVSDRLFLAKKLLQPGGYYLDYIGTRYHDDDHYGKLIEKNVGAVVTKHTPNWEYHENLDTGMKILIGKAITIKPEVELQLRKENRPVTYPEAGEEGCNLLLPVVMPYRWLMREYRENEESFEAQLNQNPRPVSDAIFDLPMLKAATVGMESMPFRGPICQIWDFAFSKKKGRDYTTGVSVIWNDKGQAFVHDLIRARFTPANLAQAVVEFAQKYRPFVIGIEDAAGSRNLEPAILAAAEKSEDQYVMAICRRIDWFRPDTQVDAKKIRMAAMHPWVINDRLKFAAYLPHLTALYDEFQRCLTSHHHDDIPDVISQIPRYAPQIQRQIADKKIDTWSRGEAGWNMIFEEGDAFGRPGMAAPPPIVEMEPDEEQSEQYAPGLDPVLGTLFG